MPWVRRMLVEEHRWLTAQAFTDTLSVCQILPGPNVVNVSVVVGARFQGGPGAVAAVTGLLSVPFLVVLVLGVLYARLGHAPAVDRLLRGLGPAAVALVLATGLKMAAPLVREPRALVFLVAAFVAVGLLRWPLVPVLLGLAPLSVVAAWMARR
jgi:chromate transporter